jgi:hypothetical protein
MDRSFLIPRSRNKGRFQQENTGNQWNLKAVIRLESLRIFSGEFRPFSCDFPLETAVKSSEKIQKISDRNTASIDFRSFSAESSDFPASFQRDSLVSGGRHHRYGILSKIIKFLIIQLLLLEIRYVNVLLNLNNYLNILH